MTAQCGTPPPKELLVTEQQQYQITEYAQRCRALDASALAHCRFSVRLFRDILEISLEKQPFPPRMPGQQTTPFARCKSVSARVGGQGEACQQVLAHALQPFDLKRKRKSRVRAPSIGNGNENYGGLVRFCDS